MREYAIALIRRSYWYYARPIAIGALFAGAGVYLIYTAPTAPQGTARLGFVILLVAFGIWGGIPLAHRSVLWRITSDRLIEQRGLLATSRREVELQDIRSIEVNRRLMQRMAGLGDVIVASAASADYIIRLSDVYDPEGVAATVRKARLRRLA